MMRTLADLSIGQGGTIGEIVGAEDLMQRLMEMGLTGGEQVEVVRFAPMGDPMEIQIQGYLLTLRRAEARAVVMEDSHP